MILDLLIAESQKNMQFQRELENKISRLPKGTIKARRVKEKTYYYLAYMRGLSSFD